MRCGNEQERTIWQFCYRKKQMDLSFSCVCSVIDNEFRHNIVKVVCRSTRLSPRGSTATLTMLWRNSWSLNIRKDAWKTDVNRPRPIYQYSSMAPRLLGQNCKFSSFFCPSIPKRDLGKKETTPNIEVWPESLGAMAIWRFSEDFRPLSKISEDFPKLFRRDEHFRTFFDDYQRLPKTTEK